MVSALSKIKTRRRATGWNKPHAVPARICPMRNIGRATGFFNARIGHKCPDVGVTLQNQRHALDRGRIGTFAAFG